MSVIQTILKLVGSQYKSDLNSSVADTKRAAADVNTALNLTKARDKSGRFISSKDVTESVSAAKQAAEGMSSALNSTRVRDKFGRFVSSKDMTDSVAAAKTAADGVTSAWGAAAASGNSKYKKSLNDSVTFTQRAAQGVKSAWSAVGNIFGFSIGLGTMLGLTKSTAGKLEELKHSAENLGMPTDEMQRWNAAARKSGLEAEAVAMAVSQMSNVINSAMTGDETSVNKLGMIGLKPSQLSGLGTSEQFGLVLDGINRVQDGTEKLALSNDLLGRSGKHIGALAASWREYKQAMDGKLIPEEEIQKGERFEQMLRKLEGLLTRIISKSGIISGLTAIGEKVVGIYEKSPDKQELENPNSFQQNFFDRGSGVKNIPDKIDYMQVAEEALRKEAMQKYNDSLKDKNWFDRTFAAKPNPGFSQTDREAWLDQHQPDWRTKEAAASAEEERNRKVKADAEAKAKEEADVKSMVTRTEAMNTDEKKWQDKTMGDAVDHDRQAQQGLNKALDEQLSTMQDQLTIQQLKLKGKEREAAITAEIQKAEKAARDSGQSLKPEQLMAIADSTGALYDAENANKPRTFAPPQPEAPIITDAALRVGAFVGPQAQQSDNVQSIWKATKDLIQENRDNIRIIKDRMPQRLDTLNNNDGPRFQDN